jgi:tetrahydromethanopterin S-methyltransferase subunit B
MNSLSMILRILAIVAALAAGTLFFMGKGKLAEQQAAQIKAEQATVTVQTELDNANDQIKKLQNNLRTERDALADEKRTLESIRSEMYTARQEVSRSQQQLKQAKQKIIELETAASGLRADLLTAEQALVETNKEAELAQLNERVAELEAANADLTESLNAAEAKISMLRPKQEASGGYQSTFKISGSQALPKASIGAATSIQSISPENGLIVLENTPELGLTVGNEVKVIKDLKALGKIKVVQLTDQLVVANLLPGAKTSEMTQGSSVKLLR